MTMSGREKAIASITIVILLYGVLGLLAKGRLDAWWAKREEYRQACRTLDQERKLISQRPEWQKKYAAVRDLMPVFPSDKQVQTHWLGVMDTAASNNRLNILKRQAGEEKPVGDVCEMAIDCKDWDGTLDALVRFLYGLESAGVMLDMRQMFIRPNPADHSHLKGSFVLFCAYMREKPAVAARSPESGTRKPAAVPPVPVRKTPAKK